MEKLAKSYNFGITVPATELRNYKVSLKLNFQKFIDIIGTFP